MHFCDIVLGELYERMRSVDKFEYFQESIENPLTEIINVHSQDDNFKRQWLEIHVKSHEVQHAISKLSQMSLKVLRTIGEQKIISENELVSQLGFAEGVINKSVKMLMHDEIINKVQSTAHRQDVPFQLTAIGREIVAAEAEMDVIIDKQHREMVKNYSMEELTIVSKFLLDLRNNH